MVEQSKIKISSNVRYVGIFSSILVALFTILFIAAFGMYMSSTSAEWPGIEEFAQNFNSTLYLAWVIPCLLLALTFPVMMSAVYFRTKDDKKIWGFLGLIFAVMYGAVLSANYFILATVVRESLISGHTEGLEWFVVLSPHSITNSIEGIGYGFMGLAAVFAGLSFGQEGIERWIKILFIVNGLSGILSLLLGPLIGESALWITLAVWVITFPLMTSFVGYLFFKEK